MPTKLVLGHFCHTIEGKLSLAFCVIPRLHLPRRSLCDSRVYTCFATSAVRCVDVDSVWARLLAGGARLLEKTPAVSSHRAAVMSSVDDRCSNARMLPVQHAASLQHHLDGRTPPDNNTSSTGTIVVCFSFPSVTPAFCPDAAILPYAVPRRFETWLMHSSFFNSTSPYTRKLDSHSLRVFVCFPIIVFASRCCYNVINKQVVHDR